MRLEIAPGKVLVGLLLMVTFLLIANLTGIFFEFYLHHDHVYGLVPLFNFGLEQNIPTLFSSFILILSSLLLFTISFSHRKLNGSYLPWFGLALIFLFLSIDEFAMIHERLTLPVRETLNASGIFFYAWVIPYGVALLLFLAVYAKFLISLKRKNLVLFVLSGTIYISGAIGLELLGGGACGESRYKRTNI